MAGRGKGARLPLRPIPKTKTWSYTQKTGHTSQPPRVDLGSLTAMPCTVASLRSVPQSTQSVHRVIQSLLLFDVVSG